MKEQWAFEGNRIAARFAYEWHDDSGLPAGAPTTNWGFPV